MDTNHKLIFKGPFMYEHMVRVPTTIRVPGALGGIGHRRVADYDWVNVDLTPTLLDLAGADVPECHGQSAKPILTGTGVVRPRPFVIGQYYGKQTWVNPIRMIRTERFKLNVYIDHGEELYDLQNDPRELVNLADDPAHAEAKRQLRADLDRWIAEHDDPFYTLKTTPLKSGGRTGAKRGPKTKESPAVTRIK
jgi:arylsulfatase A-like enzyme